MSIGLKDRVDKEIKEGDRVISRIRISRNL